MELKALTRMQQIEKETLKGKFSLFPLFAVFQFSIFPPDARAESFHSFWLHPAIVHAWTPPPLAYAEAAPLLDLAAECIVRLSASLAASERKFLNVSGSVTAREHLWTLHHLNLSGVRTEKRQFVLDVVRACLSDDDGLVDGVSEQAVVDMVDAVLHARARAGDEAEEQALQHALVDAWHALHPLLKTHEDNAAVQFGRRADRIDLLRKATSHLNRACKALLDFNNLDDAELDGSADADDAGGRPVFIRERTGAPVIEEPHSNAADRADEVIESDEPDRIDEDVPPTAASAHSPRRVAEEVADAAGATTPPNVEEPGGDVAAKKARVETAAEKATKESQLKIKRVADDVEKIGIHVKNLKEVVDQWQHDSQLEPEDVERNVDALQRQSLLYTECLMRDLMTLDEITGSDAAEELRPMRKRNVHDVQSLLDDVDTLRKRLTDLHRDMKQRADAKRAEKQAEADKAAAERKAQQEAEARAAAAAEGAGAATDAVEADATIDETEEDEDDEEAETESEAPQDDASSVPWKTLRLEPEFHVNETPDGGVELVAFVPGLKDENVDIRLVDQTNRATQLLEVAGVVLPSAEQAQQLWNSAAALKRQDAAYGRRARFAGTPVASIALRGGVNRFGTFAQRFQLPDDADIGGISASLRRGYLTVTIPRLRRRSAAPARARYPPNPTRYSRATAPPSAPGMFWW
jgi:HSP20 family molecular chaperone IbpA